MGSRCVSKDKCYVCSRPRPDVKGEANLCSEECYEEYREVLNEMAEAMADTIKGDEECSLKAEG
tara:strand:+ start:374 stop:565 length:192 start_codon:yes stop_codon:yes gene_type:complete